MKTETVKLMKKVEEQNRVIPIEDEEERKGNEVKAEELQILQISKPRLEIEDDIKRNVSEHEISVPVLRTLNHRTENVKPELAFAYRVVHLMMEHQSWDHEILLRVIASPVGKTDVHLYMLPFIFPRGKVLEQAVEEATVEAENKLKGTRVLQLDVADKFRRHGTQASFENRMKQLVRESTNEVPRHKA